MLPENEKARILTSPVALARVQVQAVQAEEAGDRDTALLSAAIVAASAGHLRGRRQSLADQLYHWLEWFLETYYPDQETVA